MVLTAGNIATAMHQSLPLGELWVSELLWPQADRLAAWLPEAGALQEITFQPLGLLGAQQTLDVPGSVLAFAPDASRVAAQGGDGGVILLDRGSGEIRPLDYGVAYGATFDPSGQVLAVFSPEQWSVTLFDVTTGEAFKTLTGFETAAPVYAVYPAGRDSVLWAARATAQFQDVQTGLLSPSLYYMEFINNLAFSADGQYLAIAAGYRFDLIPVPAAGQTPQPAILLDQSLEAVYSMAFSPDGRLLAAGQGANLRVWDVESHASLAKFSVGEEKLRLVSFSPDGSTIVALDNANVLHAWRVGE
jgi:WD40 repeat protein